MAKVCLPKKHEGFSLVELMVALFFTMLLMAGMATVFKSSLSTFYTSGELLSSARRNRMSIDLLGDDLNTAQMYLLDLSIPPQVTAAMPPFYILPNVPIPGAGGDDPQTTDELYFYLDQPLAFEGSLVGPGPARTAAELVMQGVAFEASDRTFTIDCPNEAYANQVKQGQIMIFKDSWEIAFIDTPPSAPSGTQVTVVAGSDPKSAMTGTGSAGLPSKVKHIPDSGVVVMQPAQMVRYRIEMLQLDPTKAAGIPCLVRDQGTYNGVNFVSDRPQQIVTENASGFKVYLSANSGTSWAGLGLGATGFDAGWDTGIRAELDTQLANSGRPNFKTTRGDEHWLRSIPTLVRVDVTTRTATQRSEYSNVANTAAYRNLTQTLVFAPRHTGLTMD